MAIVDIVAARDAFGELLLQIFLLPLVVILVVGSVVAVAKLAGASLKELWRRSRSQLVALSVFAVGVTIVADKPGDRGGGAADPPRSAVLPDACDVGEGFAELPAVTNLSVAAFLRGSNYTDMVVAWPESARPAGDLVDIYAGTNLLDMAKILDLDVSSCASNALLSITDADLCGTNPAPRSAFFSVGDSTDTDGDGLPDAAERLVHGTDPENPDTDGDGVHDGDEIALGTSPVAADTDGDGIVDGEELGWVMSSVGPQWVNSGNGGFTDITDNLATGHCGCAVWTLSTPFVMQGETISNLTISSKGVVFFNRAGHFNPGKPVDAMDFSSPVEGGAAVVAPMSDSGLFFRTNAPASSVKVGIVNFYSSQSVCVSFENMGRAGDGAETNSVSFQVVVQNSVTNNVLMLYRDNLGEAVDGRNAGIGVQSLHGGLLRVSYLTPGFVVSGRVVVVHLGSDSDPTLADTDRDGLLDGEEALLGTSALQPDTDGDGMDDGWEYQHRAAGFDPAVDNATDGNDDNDLDADPDGDGLTNGQECAWGTKPDGLDSDGDGVGDGAEIGQNSDPADSGDGGAANSRVPVPLVFGDPSSSYSEKYCLEVSPSAGPGPRPRAFSFVNEHYGQCETRTVMLKPGWTYEVRLKWVSCLYPPDGSYYPNYDYTLAFGQDVPQCVVLDDPEELFRSDYYGGEYYGASHFPVLDASARLQAHLASNAVLSLSMPRAMFTNDDDDNNDGVVDYNIVNFGQVVSNAEDDVVHGIVDFRSGVFTNGTIRVGIAGFEGDVYTNENTESSVNGTFDVAIAREESRRVDLYFNPYEFPSKYNGVTVTATWIPEAGEPQTVSAPFTLVRPVAEPICSETEEHSVLGTNHVYTVNPCAVAVGDDAYFRVGVAPAAFPDSDIVWTCPSGKVTFPDGNTGRSVHVRGVSPGDAPLEVVIGVRTIQAPTFPLKVVTPQVFKITAWIVSDQKHNPARRIEEVQAMLAPLNDIYRQVGVSFYLDSVTVTNIPNAYNALFDSQSIPTSTWTFDDIVGIGSGTGGLECYFINSFVDESHIKAAHNGYGIVVTTHATQYTLAHEVGHAFGLDDIYVTNAGQKEDGDQLLELLASEKASYQRLADDWNGGCQGSGSGGVSYYRSDTSMKEIVSRMVMLGEVPKADARRDITAGKVYGVYYTESNNQTKAWHKGDAQVGFPWSNRNPVHQ